MDCLIDCFYLRYRIGPFEVESALIEHPAVLESAVVSSPDAVRGEVIPTHPIHANTYFSRNNPSNCA